MSEKKKVVVAKKLLRFNRTTDKYDRLDCVEGGPATFVEKHYVEKGVPQDKVIHCVYYFEEE